MNKRIALVLLFAGSLPAAAGSETVTADEIVTRHVEARGGYERIRALDSLVFSEGLYREADYAGSGDAFMAVARPYYKVVGNPEKPGGYMEGYDGAAWEWFADPGVVVRTVGAAAGAMRRGADVEGPLVDYAAKGSSVRLGEPADVGGRAAHRLVVTLRDGFVREYLVDQETFLVVAERRSAPFHAFGEAVTSETRIGDHRRVAGVLFAHSFVQTEIASGRELSRMQWGRIEANRELPPSWFSPPEFERSPLERFLEQLYGERADVEAVMWTFYAFRRAHPEIETRAGVELVGFQMLKMGDVESAIALLAANAAENPGSSSSALGLGRAIATAGETRRARRELERALELDPENHRARSALAELAGTPAAPDNPLGFLQPFLGSWGPDPDGDFVRDNPERAADVAFRFEWGDPARKILRFFEGIPGGDFDRRILENLVAYDPRTGGVVALGFQLRDDYLYESTFRPAAEGYVREYRVTYPPAQEFGSEEDAERGWIRYRDRCTLETADRLHCVTEQQRTGEWQPWGRAEGYTLVRR